MFIYLGHCTIVVVNRGVCIAYFFLSCMATSFSKHLKYGNLAQ